MSDQPQIRFDDGAAYEEFMGKWSRLAGAVFLDWIAPPPAMNWVDVGCGNGAFTELIAERCAPVTIDGIDPSEGQLKFARTQPSARLANFQQGDAMALPYADKSFDAAVMALVIFFVPEPAKGVAEMARVVRPGGIVAAYAWDILGGGFPTELVSAEVRAMGANPPMPPSKEASTIPNMRALWEGAGLEGVATREISVERTFDSFDAFWTTTLLGPALKPTIAALAPDDAEALKQRVRARVNPDAAGRVTLSARANAVKGRVPA